MSAAAGGDGGVRPLERPVTTRGLDVGRRRRAVRRPRDRALAGLRRAAHLGGLDGNEDTGELWVAPYASVFDLPAELRELIGKDCDPKACPVDPRLVCAASDVVEWQWVSPSIHNARRGDVIMTPGDGSGLIATLVPQLEPRQFYDHMGIMVKNNDRVRHATMAHERLNRRDPGRYMTGEFFGDPAPVDGFRADILTYGWPGTITQSIDDAFFSGFNTVPPSDWPEAQQAGRLLRAQSRRGGAPEAG